MAHNETENCCEKFKTMIGGQALIEGIMMRGPDKDAIVIRGKDGLTVEVSDRKKYPENSFKKWPFFRGMFTFFAYKTLPSSPSTGTGIPQSKSRLTARG